MNEVFAYALLLAGVPVFVGMFVGSFIGPRFSRLLGKSTNRLRILHHTQVEYVEVINGLVAAIAAVFLFRVCALGLSPIVPVVLAAWISIYCLATHQHVPNWLSWLSGVVIGWLVLGLT